MDEAHRFDQTARCLVVVGGHDVRVLPVAHWFDGGALWTAVSGASAAVTTLRGDGECAVVIPPAGDHPGVAAHARARVFTREQPARLALHAPVIGAALSALAARNVTDLVSFATQAPLDPGRLWPVDLAVLRLEIASTRRLVPPPQPVGVGPPLPTVLPADVRRRVSGVRTGVVAWNEPPLRITSASWRAGFALAFPGADAAPPAHTRVSLIMTAERSPDSEMVGAALHGAVDREGTLIPDHATWWHGLATDDADVASPSSAGVVLPD